jgi:hypothetical protein
VAFEFGMALPCLILDFVRTFVGLVIGRSVWRLRGESHSVNSTNADHQGLEIRDHDLEMAFKFLAEWGGNIAGSCSPLTG